MLSEERHEQSSGNCIATGACWSSTWPGSSTLRGHHSQGPGDSPRQRPRSSHSWWRAAGERRRSGRSDLTRKRKTAPQGEVADCRRCCTHVTEGQVVILDSGHYDHRDRSRAAEHQHITIITNAVNIAAELSGSALEVILPVAVLERTRFSGRSPSPKRRCTNCMPTFCFWESMDSMCSMDSALPTFWSRR